MFIEQEIKVAWPYSILSTQDTQKLFTGSKAKEMIKAPAKEVKRPTLVKYRVFVQNGGGDTRCLKKGTKLLYEVT